MAEKMTSKEVYLLAKAKKHGACGPTRFVALCKAEDGARVNPPDYYKALVLAGMETASVRSVSQNDWIALAKSVSLNRADLSGKGLAPKA